MQTNKYNTIKQAKNGQGWMFQIILGVQLCFRRFPIDGFSGKWWSK